MLSLTRTLTTLGRRQVPAALGVVLVTLLLAPASAKASPPAPTGTAVRGVAFQVTNLNQSGVPCASDGARYTVVGHLVTPVSGGLPGSVALYLHGLGFGEFFWDFSAVPGYDYAQAMAERGLASVVIDRVGYGASGHPPGTMSCLGSQATVAHEIVADLRSGHYSLDTGSSGPRFQRVTLAGHSAGGAIAEIEASSFQDVDGLVVMAYADLGATQRATEEFGRAGTVCAQGGEPAGPGQPTGYAPFGQTAADFKSDMFFDANPEVVADTTAMRHLDPCGDDGSFPPAIAHNVIGLGGVRVPVLLIYGAEDALFQPPGTARQQALFTGSTDVSTVVLPRTGHALTLERSAPRLRAAVAAWLTSRGLA